MYTLFPVIFRTVVQQLTRFQLT